MGDKPSHKAFSRRGNGWHQVGAAWPANSGNGTRIKFDSLPLPDPDGNVTVYLFDNKDKADDVGKAASTERPGGVLAGLDDDVPF